VKPQIHDREFKRDEVPLGEKIFPLSFEGEGDTGGEVETDDVGRG